MQSAQGSVVHRVSPLTADQKTGYIGHDVIELRNGQLFHSFPFYRRGDTNAAPSGDTVTYRYALRQRAWVNCARPADQLSAPTLSRSLLSRDNGNLDIELWKRQPRLDAGTCWCVLGNSPGVPHGIHFVVIAHVAEPDRSRQQL